MDFAYTEIQTMLADSVGKFINNEPQARYALTSVATTADRDGDAWVLNGNKGLVPNGGSADLVIVPARTSGKSGDENGITLFALNAHAVGIVQVLKDKTVEYSKNRKQFGVPIGSFQELQHRMVDMLMACEQAQSLLMWSAMTRAADGDNSKRAVSAIKYLIGTEGKKLGEDAIQIHGGMGMTDELGIGHYFKRLTIFDSEFGNVDHHMKRHVALSAG